MTLDPQVRRPRIVVENPDREAGLAQVTALEAAGCSVSYCPGPTELPGGLCPAVDGTGCTIVADADAVLYDLDLDEPYNREVLVRLRRSYPAVAVVVEVPAAVARKHADVLRGCHVVTPYDMDRLVRAVGAAAADPTPRPAPVRPIPA